MDKQAQEYYDELTERSDKLRYTTWPQIQAISYRKYGDSYLATANRDYITLVPAYQGLYSEWYRCLAYMQHGYGNLSNNDRARHGLKPKRKRRKRRGNE